MAASYPPVSFHFQVKFIDEKGAWDFDSDFRFQSVSGLDASLETSSFAEGGENRFTHALPTRARYPNLILKRGLITDSLLIDWCEDAIIYLNIYPLNVDIGLLDDSHQPLIIWTAVHAYPVRWSISEFNAEQNQLAIETLELKYQYFYYSF